MKTIFSILLFAVSFTLCAQKIIDNPVIGISNRQDVFVTKVELKENETILTINVKLPVGSSNIINKNEYIQIEGDTIKLRAIKCLDYKFGESVAIPDENGIFIRTVFPPVDPPVSKINYIDPHPSGWKFFDIELVEQEFNSIVPKELIGNWFSTESGDWTFSFFDTIAIFDNKTWKYDSFKNVNGVYEIVVKNDNIQKTLRCEADHLKNYFIYEKGEKYRSYTNYPQALFKSLNEKQKSNYFNNSLKTIYKGVIRNYNPQLRNFVSLRYSDKKSKEEFAKVVDIEKDGSFTFELEINNPQEISVMLPTGDEDIFSFTREKLISFGQFGRQGFSFTVYG